MLRRGPLILALVASVTLSACGPYIVRDPHGKEVGWCDDGVIHSICDLHVDKDDKIVSGGGYLPTVNSGAALVTEGVTVGELLAK